MDGAKQQKCRIMEKEMETCEVRKFGCNIEQNSMAAPFSCPTWSAWNEWTSCQYQHPCSPNKTRVDTLSPSFRLPSIFIFFTKVKTGLYGH